MSKLNKKPVIKSDNIRSYCSSISKELGINPAIVLHYIAYWVEHNCINNIPLTHRNNNYWMYKTRESMGEWLGMNEPSVRHSIKILLEKGLINRSNKLNKDSRDRTYWYSLTTKILEYEGNTYNNLQIIKYLSSQKQGLATDNLLSNKNTVPTEKKLSCINNIYDINIEDNKENNNINIIKQAKASSSINKNLDVDLGMNNNPNSLTKEKEIPNLNNKEENNPSIDIPREENREEYTEPKIENKDPHFLPIEYDIQYPNKVDLVTKKVSPRYSEAQYKTTVIYLQKWAESKGTKHKILPYGDISNKSFIKALEAVSYYSTDILEFFKNNTWDSKWLKATNITEETLKQAIQLRGGDFEAFKYACGQQCYLFTNGITHLDHRAVSKSFNDFIKTTYKDGKSMSWLLYHIVNDSQVVTVQKDYFWNTVENLSNKFIYEEAQKDIKKFFPTEQNHQKVIDWINYLHEFTIALWKVKPSTRYSTFDKDINKLIAGMHTMLTINNNFKDRLPKHFTFGKYDKQIELLEKIRRYGLDDFSDKVLECIQDGSINKLPRYQY